MLTLSAIWQTIAVGSSSLQMLWQEKYKEKICKRCGILGHKPECLLIHMQTLNYLKQYHFEWKNQSVQTRNAHCLKRKQTCMKNYRHEHPA